MTRLLAVGDVGPKRTDPNSMFAGVADILARGDLVFGQLETVITEHEEPSANAKLAMRSDPDVAPAIRRAGFDVMSFAGNHCLDFGRRGLFDTLAAADAAGIALCGAGADLAAARRPAILSREGTRFAFLAYNSILPEGYAAERTRPGCAPLRAHTVYRQIEPDQPGTPAEVLSFCDRGDLAAMEADIAAARQQADVVIVSMHWGIHMVEAVLADYQREAAHRAIDAGAAAVLGHHAHILKGVEFHRGAPIFYSLGNFAIEQPHTFDPAIVETASFRHLMSLNPSADPAALYVLPPDTRLTGLASLEFDGSTLVETSLIPAVAGDDSAPQLARPGSEGFAAVAEYLGRVSSAAGLATEIRAQGDRLVLSPT